MEAATPALLSGLSQLLLRRPPSLRELVMLVGYADDYAWFAGLVRRLFPEEAEAALTAPDLRTRVERFANLFGDRHFPLYAPVIEFWTEDGDDPPWSWLRRGIPFDLMGFGYDGLYEMWDGYREGLSALALLGQDLGRLLRRPRRAADGLAGIGRRAHPAGNPPTASPRRRAGRDPHRGGEGYPVRGGGQGRRLGLRRDRQLLPRPLLRGCAASRGIGFPT